MRIKYKQLMLSVILSAWTVVGWAQAPQVNCQLSSDETGTFKNYIARESIILKPGFHFQAKNSIPSPDNPNLNIEDDFFFSAKIDAGLLFPTNDKMYKTATGGFTTDPTQGYVVGAIQGTASISPSGAAVYQIPILVPKGVNGVQPQIGLVYNSQNSSGLLGTGWNLIGVSSISRGSKNICFDGVNDIIHFNDADPLMLDGQRLIKLSGNDLQPDAIYGFEQEDFTRIKILSNPLGGIYFVVTTKDGKTMEYGKTEDSKVKNANGNDDDRVLCWSLNKMSDVCGAYINYSYSQLNVNPTHTIPEHTESVFVAGHNEVVHNDEYNYDYNMWVDDHYENVVIPEQIFQGTGIEQHLHKIEYGDKSVEFSYVLNTVNPKKTFIGDFKITQTYCLSSITIYSGTTKLTNYGFEYSSDNKLITISEAAADNTKLNSTKINWGNAEVNSVKIQEVNVDNVADLNLNWAKGASMYMGDVNGDGYPDRIELWLGNLDNWLTSKSEFERGHIWVHLYNPITKKYMNDSEVYYFDPFDFVDSNESKQNRRIVLGDINNDGKDEIITSVERNWDDRTWPQIATQYSIEVLSFNNNALEKKSIAFPDNSIFPDIFTADYFELFVADVDKDGYNDICYAFKNDELLPLLGVNVGYGSIKGSENILESEYLLTESFTNLYQRDFWHQDHDFNLCHIGDFDADSKLDIVGISNATDFNTTFTAASNKLSYSASALWYKFDETDPEHVYPADFNGDGLPDMIVQRKDNHNWILLENNGGANIIPTVKQLTTINSVYNKHSADERYRMYPIDYNGDGLMDLVLGDETFSTPSIFDNWGVSHFLYTDWYFYKNIGGEFVHDSENDIVNSPYRIDKLNGVVTDVNNDGVPDLMLPRTFDDSDKKFVALTMPKVNQRNVVTAITNGMGLRDEFTYKYFSDFAPYTSSEANSVVRPLRGPILLVDTHKEIDGTLTEYEFENPVVHTKGRGFLGFKHVKAANLTRNLSQITNYGFLTTPNDNSAVSLFPDTLKTGTYNGVWSSKVESTMSSSYSTLGEPLRFMKIPYKDKTINYLTGSTEVSKSYYTSNFDVFKQETNLNSGAKVTEIETQYTLPVGKTTNQLLGVEPYLPAKVTNTITLQGEAKKYISISTYEYDTNGTLTKAIKDVGDDNAVMTEYKDIDGFGHAHTIDVTSNGNKRQSKVEYTPSGLNVLSQTNPLGVKNENDWDEIHGLQNSETNTLTHKTTLYSYNGSGQLIETKYPDGNRKAQNLQWAGSNSFGATYFAYSENSGSAPVYVYYDAMGREVRRESTALNGNKVYVYTLYRSDGRVDRVSLPTFDATIPSGLSKWGTIYGYDDFGRVEKVTTQMGDVITDYEMGTPNSTVTSPDGKTKIKIDNAGNVSEQVKYSVDGLTTDKSVRFTYYASGLVKTSTPDNSPALTMEYNQQGKRTKLIDPDAGTTTTVYNGFGDMMSEIDAMGIETKYIYEPTTGELNRIERNGEITSYVYDTQHRISSVEIVGKNKQMFGYDGNDRVVDITETIGTNKTFTKHKEYDFYGRVKKEVYPTGYYVRNNYDSFGNLIEIIDRSGKQIWKANEQNERGQLTSISQGGRITTFGYDSRGLPNSISTEGVMDLTLLFDIRGNLRMRNDNLTSQIEDIDYDGFNRLKRWRISRDENLIQENTFEYDNLTGNIKGTSSSVCAGYDVTRDKSKLIDRGGFTWSYGEKHADGITSCGPHALTTIAGVPNGMPSADLNVTYTDFRKIAKLTEGNNEYAITYGVDDERRKSEYKVGNVLQKTRYYVGDYEEETDHVTGNVRKIHYLSGAILIQENGTEHLYYTCTDYQGSLVALTDENGLVVERYAYDPWGVRRNPDMWEEKDLRTTWIVNRGYTGHEHLDAFGIINMNGRVYDPLTAMFFSPDPYIQSPNDWLNYNRYSYCLNNPFKYTDPSGKLFVIDDVVIGGIILAAIQGAAISAVIYEAGVFTGAHTYSGKAFWNSVGNGALSAAFTRGIGFVFGATGGAYGALSHSGLSPLENELLRAGAHGIVQGGISVMNGGNFGQGFVSGAFGSLAGSAFESYGGAFAQSDFGLIAFSSFSGGIGSVLMGGDFFEGAKNGLFVGLFNVARDKLSKQLEASIMGLINAPENANQLHNAMYNNDRNAQLKIGLAVLKLMGGRIGRYATGAGEILDAFEAYVWFETNYRDRINRSLQREDESVRKLAQKLNSVTLPTGAKINGVSNGRNYSPSQTQPQKSYNNSIYNPIYNK